MSIAKKSLEYALVFAAGTILSGSVAFAATTYVQAQKETTTVQYQGTTISQPNGLVYGGTTYVQLYSIEQALKQAGITPGWNGSILSLNKNSVAKLSGGTSDTFGTSADIGYSISSVLTDTLDFVKEFKTVSPSSQQAMIKNVGLITADLNDNIAAIQKDTPSDQNLVKIQAEYLDSLHAFNTAYNGITAYLRTGSNAGLTSFETDFETAATGFEQAMSDFNKYSFSSAGLQ